MIWYLGIDIGNTGISAVLFNKESQEIHPIYWLNRANENQQETSFRLPGVGFARILPGTEIDPSTTSIFVGYLA
ncbi:MAG TPA: hypothetical protein V6C58_01415, partial [Allocoleopsis sp.]